MRVNSYHPIISRFEIKQTELILQDYLFNFADLTKQVDRTVFSSKKIAGESYEKNDSTQFMITFHHNLDL